MVQIRDDKGPMKAEPGRRVRSWTLIGSQGSLSGVGLGSSIPPERVNYRRKSRFGEAEE